MSWTCVRKIHRPRLPVALAVCSALIANSVAAAPPQQAPEPLRVAAAISLRDALESIAADFEKHAGVKVVLTFGSSGQLLAQIRNGAPLDIFVSAAREQVDALERESLVLSHSRRVIAGNRLVLIVPRRSEFKPSTFEDLTDPRVKRLAIGDPGTVPAGQYAREVLEHFRLAETLGDRLIHGTNVRQVLDYVVRGEVSAGLVYATDARAESEAVDVVATADTAWHNPIEYPAVVLKSCRDPLAAGRFLESLGEPRAVETLQKHGFTLPPPKSPPTKPADASPFQPTSQSAP